MPTIETGVARRALTIGLLLAALGSASTASAAKDRQAPTTPTNLRVTALGPYGVTLAWEPSRDNSGQFSYVVCCANVSSQTFPGGSSTFTYTAGLEASRTFTLRIQAVDAAGNYSKASNAVTFTTPADRIPPTRPLVSVTSVGARHVSLLWSSIENGPYVWFTVLKNGTPVLYGTRDTSATLPLLEPETAYTFTVQARDFGGNNSLPSEPLTVTTAAANGADVTPPSSPAPLFVQNWGCEVELDWAESTDDLDPQFLIEYKVFVNGVYDHSLSLRHTRTITYATRQGANTFSVVAVDTAGNESEPATVASDLLDCFP